MSYRIKCNGFSPRYLYWNGVAWTASILGAAEYPTLKAAKKALADLSRPRNADPKGYGPEVFDLAVSGLERVC
jgi:hypothetical protein